MTDSRKDVRTTPGSPPHHVVVVGAGAVGLACARSLLHAGCRVTVLDRSERILGIERPRILETSQRLVAKLVSLEQHERKKRAS